VWLRDWGKSTEKEESGGYNSEDKGFVVDFTAAEKVVAAHEKQAHG